jgi:arginine decarboxylase
MLHIFLNKGIKDDIYYWSELNKIINLYCQLKKICPELDSINIGGGFPIKHSLGFEYDYQFMINGDRRQYQGRMQKGKSADAEYLYRIRKFHSRRKHGAYL